jgi:hypothetical protein|tara:strand:- start:1422 stop:1538 length:117 start_codon:yes stop_codon:yes gene_type:complete
MKKKLIQKLQQKVDTLPQGSKRKELISKILKLKYNDKK